MKNENSRHSALENNIGFLFYRIGLKMKTAVQREFSEKGYPITTDQWGILQVLSEKGGLCQQDLADYVAKDKANVHRIVVRMEKDGLIKREPYPGDRRKYLVSLTDRAIDMMKELKALADKTKIASQRNISTAELERLKNTINQIYKNLE